MQATTESKRAIAARDLRVLPLVERAKRIAPILSQQAAACEAAGKLTQDTLDALRSERLLSFWLPRCFGGDEAMPLDSLEAIETLCRADGSIGWVVMAAQAAMGTAAAFLAPSAAKLIFGEGAPIIAGQGQPNGKASIESGGYRLHGRWAYGSGTLHAEYVHTGAAVYLDGKPRLKPGSTLPEAKIFIVPIRDVKLLGNWDTLGLRATGSVDYAIDGAHVPEEFTHGFMTKLPNQGGDLYRLGISGFSAIAHSAFAFGVARRALDELAAIGAGERPPSIMSPPGSETFHHKYAHAEATLRAVRALGFEVWVDAQKTIERGNPLSVRQSTLARLVVNHATTVASDITSFAFRYAGGIGTRYGTLQRCFRDMQTGAQHATASPLILGECGRELLGLHPTKIWGFRSLIDPQDA
nr:hypothetical protein [Nitrosomonas nitrosa]